MRKMKLLLGMCAILAAAFAGGFASQHASTSAWAGNSDRVLEVDELRAKRVIVMEPGCSRRVDIIAGRSVAGVWVSGPAGRTITMLDAHDYTAIGLYCDSHSKENTGFNLALWATKDDAQMQWISPAKR